MQLLTRHRFVVYMPGLRYLQAAVFQRAKLSTHAGGHRQCTETGEQGPWSNTLQKWQGLGAYKI